MAPKKLPGFAGAATNFSCGGGGTLSPRNTKNCGAFLSGFRTNLKNQSQFKYLSQYVSLISNNQKLIGTFGVIFLLCENPAKNVDNRSRG